ncbi:hypothetical protein GCM10010431_33890 [Streptomyces kunmingensis]|nr:hypothetical protein [Streptomyces kunmingensis]
MARAQIDGLAAAGRQSSGKLRDLLRMLRDPADAVPLQPVPGLGELESLLDSHRAAGGTVEVRAGTALESLPGPVQLAGYRVVQEALVNARRHAPGAPVRLTLEGVEGELRCEIVNGRGARRGAAGAGVGLGLVTKPLGMKDSYLDTNDDRDTGKEHVSGYEPDAARLKALLAGTVDLPEGVGFAGPERPEGNIDTSAVDPSWAWAAGGMVSTAQPKFVLVRTATLRCPLASV